VRHGLSRHLHLTVGVPRPRNLTGVVRKSASTWIPSSPYRVPLSMASFSPPKGSPWFLCLGRHSPCLREYNPMKCIRASSPMVTMNKAIQNQNITSSPNGLNSLDYHLLCPASPHICNTVCLYPERGIADGADTGMSFLFCWLFVWRTILLSAELRLMRIGSRNNTDTV
jgi:hypothetical protein